MRLCAGTILTSVMLSAAVSAAAEGADGLTGHAAESAMPVYAAGRRVYRLNPATMICLDSVSRSVMSAGAHYAGSDKAVMEQLGTGSRDVEFSARSYRRTDTLTAVWGHASFTTRRVSDVRWTDCIDYRRVAPYVLGDSVGGYLSSRRYTFGGGISRRSGNWTIGAEASYRAEIAGRSRDPRVKTIVSDLSVSIGASRMAGRRRMAGVCASVGIYSQNSELDFYNPVNDIDTYTLTGLGSVYRRFMGNTNKNSGYSSVSFSVGAQLVTTGHEGLKCAAGYSQWRMSQQLRSFNNLTLAYTDHRRGTATASWRFETRRLAFEPGVSATVEHTTGTENLFGSSQGASYDKIGSRSPYRHDVVNVRAEIPVETRRPAVRLGLKPAVAFETVTESLSEPHRRLSASLLTASVTAVAAAPLGRKWVVTGRAGYEKTVCLSAGRLLTGLDLTSGLGQCVVSNHDMQSASRNGFEAGAEAGRTVCGVLATLGVRVSVTRFRDQTTRRTAAAVISFKF